MNKKKLQGLHSLLLLFQQIGIGIGFEIRSKGESAQMAGNKMGKCPMNSAHKQEFWARTVGTFLSVDAEGICGCVR